MIHITCDIRGSVLRKPNINLYMHCYKIPVRCGHYLPLPTDVSNILASIVEDVYTLKA